MVLKKLNKRLAAQWALCAALAFAIIAGACDTNDEKGPGGGDVNTAALEARITAAENLLLTAEVDTDGSSLPSDTQWVTAAEKAALESAIERARDALIATNQAAVNYAVSALNDAMSAFTRARKSGLAAPSSVNYRDELLWGNVFAPATLGLTPGNDTTELYFNWYSTGAPAGKAAQIRVIKGTREEGTQLIEATGTVINASSGYTAHKVTVTGLQPGADYQYAVSSDGTNWSVMHDIKIPAAGAFRFAAMSDPQIQIGAVDSLSRYVPVLNTCGQGWLETMAKIAAANPSFIAAMGDQVETAAGNELEYTAFFAPPGLRNLPFAPTVGNHDRAAGMFKSHFNLPNEMDFSTGAGSETDKMGNYYYLYNNILFVVLNSHGTGSQMNSVTTAQVFIERYDQTLTAAKEAHTQYDWLIVQHHKSTASVANHAADFDIQYFVEAGFEKLMSDHNVDFVLAGHDHVYARSYPLSGRDGGKVSVPNKTKGNGTVGETIHNPGDPIYLTFTTASGQGFYPVSTDPSFSYNNALYQKGNNVYPYLGESTEGDGSTLSGSSSYMAGNLPVSNAKYVQPFIPSYTIVEVDGKSITFSTYPITTLSGRSSGASQDYDFDENTPYDSVTVTKD